MFIRGGSEVQNLFFSYTIFDRNGDPFDTFDSKMAPLSGLGQSSNQLIK